MHTKTIRLSRPINLANGEAWDIELREPTVGDMLKVDGLNDGARAVKMLELLAGITAREATTISLVDLPKIREAILGFFPESRPGGGSS